MFKRALFFGLVLGAMLWCGAVSSAAEDMEIFNKLQNRITSVSKRVAQSVVHIKVVIRQNQREIAAAGSGVIMDNDGYIITNQHVVENAESVRVFLPDVKKPYYAKIIGEDRQTDIALLKIDLKGKKINPPVFGDDKKLEVGQWVIAVGNPYGLERTVSFGIISAIGRNLPIGFLINNFIQTDAMIDFGSSGGPLVDLYGRIIGINSRGQGRGIGFTVPINTVLKVVADLKKRGQIERAWLGVVVQPLNRDLAEYMGMPNETGVIVNQVIGDSPAAKAGIKVGDIITYFNGKNIEAEDEKELKDVFRLIADSKVGSLVKLKVRRNGKLKTLTVKLGRQPKIDADEEEIEKLGFNVKEITNDIYLQYLLDTKKGVFVSYVDPGSAAGRARLMVGDVIKKIDGKNVRSISDFRKIIKKKKSKKRILLEVRRGRSTVLVLIKRDARVKKGLFKR